MKKIVPLFLILMVCFTGVLYLQFNKVDAKLEESKVVKKQADDFILHMRVDEADNGIQVLRSIQYVGEEPIEITHQSPLVSVSFLIKNHDYTGSTVSKVLKKGDVYPQKEITFSSPEKGECNLYVQARLNVNNEVILIEHVEKLIFE